MSDTKISAQTAFNATPLYTDIIPMVRDPGGTPLSRKVTYGNVLNMYGHNAVYYGAVGDGSTDDTSAVQAAITAAAGAGGSGLVLLPGGKSYKITSSLTVSVGGLHLVGLGGRNATNDGDPPALIWGGSAGGTLFDANVSSCFGLRFDNVFFKGSGTNNPAILLRIRGAKIDSGTAVHNCWFTRCTGNAISVEGGATNFRITGGRFDDIPTGYALYADLSTADEDFICTIDGNVTWVGGGATNGKGFIFMDGEAAASGGQCHLTINGLHTEVNQDLVQTYASGVNPFDQYGVIRLGVTTSSSNLQHQLTITDWDHSAAFVTSHSCIQVTSTSGTAADAALCSNVCILGASGLNNFNGSDANASGEVRLIGGNIPSDQRWPFNGYRHGQILWGRGKNSSYEGVRHWVNTDIYQIRGLTIQTSTYANRNTSAATGSLAVFTDSTTLTWGATISGGGANTVLAWYNGSNWTVFGR